MKEQSLKPVIEKLEDLFSKFNEKFYNNELDKPIITVSPDTTKGAYGWCTAWKAWSTQEKVTDFSQMKPERYEFSVTFQLTNEQIGRIHKLIPGWKEYVDEDGKKPFADYTLEKVFQTIMQIGSTHTINDHIRSEEYRQYKE
jgi:hypothetical protein|nr:MAG TPA: hypothetical protein [Caudoviricetes sp.]